MNIAAVKSQMNTSEDDFFCAIVNEPVNFADDVLRWTADGFTSEERDNAVRAEVITAVLNFDESA